MDMPADQYALYAEFGIAAEKAQVVEVAASNVALGFLAMFVNTKEISPEETEMYRAVINDVNAKAFGRLLKHLKNTAHLDDNLTNIVDEALERRNYLTHLFFRTHNFALYSEDGRKVMMAELKEIQGKLDLAHQVLEGMATVMDDLGARLVGRSPVDAVEISFRLQGRGKRVDI